MAHSFCGTPIDMSNFCIHCECFEAIKSLRNNADIVITKANKSNTVVIFNKTDYLTKMPVRNSFKKSDLLTRITTQRGLKNAFEGDP